MWTLLPLLAVGETEQFLSVDVSFTDDPGMLEGFARCAGIGATARASCRICSNFGRRDESRAMRIGTVRGVRCGKFENQVSIRGDQFARHELDDRIDGYSLSTAFERLLGG